MNYTDLEVWKEARYLVKVIYEMTRLFPDSEKFGLISQIQRAAISIPSNIAEGCGRETQKDSIRFFYISRGSLYELETQLYLVYDLGFINQESLEKKLETLQKSKKLLSGFIKYFASLIPKSKN